MIHRILGNDPALVALTFTYIFAVTGVTELLRRGLSLPSHVSRKMVHMLVAAWALPTALFFQDPGWAALAPAVFIGLNALSYRFRIVKTFEEEGAGSPGTIYFAVSFTALILLFWPLDSGRAACVAGMFAMGFGDATASLVGRGAGKRLLPGTRGTKTVEGTVAMAMVSFLTIGVGTVPLLGGTAWGAAAVAAGVGAAVEAPSTRGLDNILVPLASAGAFLGMLRLSG